MGSQVEMATRRIETLSEGKPSVFKEVAERHKVPAYVYFEDRLQSSAQRFLDIPAPYGLAVRYAMKANPNAAILRMFDNMGMQIDASTFNEVKRAMDKDGAGIEGSKIQLTSQEVQSPKRLRFLAEHGVHYTACSLEQLRTYGETLPGTEVGIRFNIGIGSGGNERTSTGGPNSSFGIYEQREEIDQLLEQYNLTVKTVHVHIGSGSDPEKQKEAMPKALEIVDAYPTVDTLDMGGGFKVGRMTGEKETDIEEMGRYMRQALLAFNHDTGREIKLEVEPGTAVVANAGFIVAEVVDIKNTGPDGKQFLVINGGMNMNTRPALYGAQHPLYVVSQDDGQERDVKDYIVAGINCESGDVLTVKPGDPDALDPRLMMEASLGDLVVIGGTGAYGSAMSVAEYNSQQKHVEVLVREDGEMYRIRKRQKRKDIWKDERVPEYLRRVN